MTVQPTIGESKGTQRIHDDRERAEMWFSQHLHELVGVDIQGGVTGPAERETRIREAIAKHGLADKVLGRFNGREENYRQFCRRALRIDVDAIQ